MTTPDAPLADHDIIQKRHERAFLRRPTSVAFARKWLAECMARIVQKPSDDLIDSAVLGLSEVATNAVRHGGGRHFVVTCTVTDQAATIEVLDSGTGGEFPAVQGLPPDTAVGGRGLWLVERISGGDWEWDTGSGGTRVRFRLRLDADPPQHDQAVAPWAATPRAGAS